MNQIKLLLNLNNHYEFGGNCKTKLSSQMSDIICLWSLHFISFSPSTLVQLNNLTFGEVQEQRYTGMWIPSVPRLPQLLSSIPWDVFPGFWGCSLNLTLISFRSLWPLCYYIWNNTFVTLFFQIATWYFIVIASFTPHSGCPETYYFYLFFLFIVVVLLPRI